LQVLWGGGYTLKYEEVYLNEYGTFNNALQNIDRFIEEV